MHKKSVGGEHLQNNNEYNQHFEPLGNGIQVIVNDIHHFSTDTILLADFAMPKANDNAVDLGSGCGTIPLLWARNNNTAQITAVEIQQDAVDLITDSINHNSLQNQITVVHSDLKQLKGKLPFGHFNLVCCNPPYKQEGSGIKNPHDAKQIARHELHCTIDDITLCASKLLQFGGRFYMCQRPERLTDILISMRQNDLEPKCIRFVQQRKSKEPKLVLIGGRKGGKKGSLVTMPTLFIEDESGDFSQEMKNIYGCYKDDSK